MQNPGAPNDEALLTIAEARTALGGVSRTTIWRLVTAGELAAVRIGRRTMFEPAELRAYVARHRERRGIEVAG